MQTDRQRLFASDVFVDACICVFMYVCMYVCMRMYVCIFCVVFWFGQCVRLCPEYVTCETGKEEGYDA